MKKTIFCVLFVVSSLTSVFSQQLDVVAYDRALFAQLESEPMLFENPGVVAVGIGEVAGDLGLHVFVADALDMLSVPATLGGVPVKTFVTGDFFLVDGGPAHQALFPTPVPMGVQTTNGNVSRDGFIAVGTLGFKACDATDPNIVGYVTNNHVGAAGGQDLCVNSASIGTPEYQFRPAPRGPRIGTLSRIVNISFTTDNRVDGVFVQSDNSLISDRLLDIGWPTTAPGDPLRLLGQLVQKSGRTTGYTQGRISAVNAIINVNMGSTCGRARFVDQIIVEAVQPPDAFLASGDSGSSLLDMDNNLIGLLFAGSDTSGFGVANRISDVLAQLNLTLNCPTPNNSTTVFPHFANGLTGSFNSSLILLNPSATDGVYGVVTLQDQAGAPLRMEINSEQAPGRLSFFVNPLGLSVFNTTGQLADLQVGSMQLGSSGRIDGSVVFSQRGAGAAGVGAVNPTTSFVAPTFRNVRDGLNSGLAIMNVRGDPVTMNLTLRDASGTIVPNGTRSLSLPANGQLSQYIDQFFPSADGSNITGTIQVTSSAPIAAVTVMSQNYLTTLPVAAAGSAGNQAFFPQFAVGLRGAFSSSLVVFNPSASGSISGSILFSDTQGNPLRVELDGTVINGSMNFNLGPLGLRVIKTTGQPQDFQVGSVRVNANGPVSGSVLFSQSGVGLAGVGNSPPTTAFIAPMFRDLAASNKNTGIAFMNVQDTSVNVNLTLRDAQGNIVPNGTQSITLLPRGQLASFVDGLFPNASINGFSGTLSATSSAPITAVVIALDANSLTTLPVTIQTPAP